MILDVRKSCFNPIFCGVPDWHCSDSKINVRHRLAEEGRGLWELIVPAGYPDDDESRKPAGNQ